MSKELNKEPAEQAGGDERAVFEFFVRKHCGMPEHIAVNWDAKFTNDAWEGWKARAALAQPSPAHPAPVEQAGGDERDFQAKGAQEVPSPVSKEYDRHLIGLLRKGEALPGHQEEAADEIERLRDWNDHLNNTVLPNILNPNFLMLMKGGERLLDLCTKDGKFIGVSLNDMKDVFDWMVTHARIAPDHAALAQPSPAQAEAEAERPEVAEVAFVLRNIGAMDAEDIDGDNVDLRFEDAEGRDTGCDVSIVEYAEKAADLFEQHDRIVGELRAENAKLSEALDECDGDRWKLRSERDAALARVSGLRSLLNPILCYVENDIERMRGDRDKSDNKEIYDLAISLAMERLKAAQHAVFTTEPGCDTAVELASHITAQAQHSVPQAWLDVQAERRRQITAEGWTPEHDDEHSHGQMARAAACYALAGSSAPNDGTAALLVSLAWPWDEQWWKPSTARRDMVKACALGLAEIERLDRAAPGKEGNDD